MIAFSGTPYIPVLAIASDSVSIAAYGVRERIIEDTNITDLNVARQRAIVEPTAYKDPLQQASFKTYVAGLRTRQPGIPLGLRTFFISTGTGAPWRRFIPQRRRRS